MATAPWNYRLFLFRCLLAVASSLVAFALAEIACRILMPEQASVRFQQDVDELQGLKLDEAARMIRNDPELFWKLAPGSRIPDDAWPFFGVIANGQSLREDHEIPPEKPPGQTRILFLGDSCTFGYGVAHDATFVEVVESLLKGATGKPVECINAGVPGYSLFQGYRYLITEGLQYQPDLVVLTFGWNDSGVWDHLGDRDHHAILREMQPPTLLRQSRVCQLIWRHWNKPAGGGAGIEARPRLLPSEFAETLEQIRAVLEPHHIPLLVFVWPMKANADPAIPADARTPLQTELMTFGKAHPLATDPPIDGVLDLVPLGRELVGKHGAGAIYFDQGHVTPLGHRAIAEAIADHLAPWLRK
jgi:lysophospholipase L1-like esterase